MDTQAQAFRQLPPKRLTIGKLAHYAGVSIDTLRFYERQGLLTAPRRTAFGYRLYAPGHVDQVLFIRRAKGLGFSVAEISELLKLSGSRSGRASAMKVAQSRLTDLDRKIREMTTIREALSHFVTQYSGEGAVRGPPTLEGMLGELPAQDREGASRPQRMIAGRV